MDIGESKIGYKQFLGVGSSPRKSDIVLRNSSYRVATVCLGLLCVLMLAGIIGQSIHYQKVEKETQDNVKVIDKEKENLQDSLKALVDKMNKTMQDRKCVNGWQKFENSCYYTSNTKKSWQKSREYCQGKGADLAIITSQNEMNFINGLFGNDREVWIGLADEGVEGVWKWVDGTPLTLEFWGAGQPNSHKGTDQDCVEFWHRASGKGEWNDENSTGSHRVTWRGLCRNSGAAENRGFAGPGPFYQLGRATGGIRAPSYQDAENSSLGFWTYL
ncbi:unnamed protein product [Pleuronectes platessa]|uniref:C-type lectin domain-containing protein n=1 Tax=Pleuronectes platessa TaxID=8262 RepID=A0A9N7TT16_PLEPL|nr:unnamed protein product [Pleuronectes platessa]